MKRKIKTRLIEQFGRRDLIGYNPKGSYRLIRKIHRRDFPELEAFIDEEYSDDFIIHLTNGQITKQYCIVKTFDPEPNNYAIDVWKDSDNSKSYLYDELLRGKEPHKLLLQFERLLNAFN